METRREFVKRGLMAGAALALPTACQFGNGRTAGIGSAQIEKLRTSLQGHLILPDDQVYETARRVHYRNPMTDKRPGVIAQCERPDDVARCIDFARQHDLEIAVRGGAHSFLGWGTCDDGLVIDISAVKGTTIDPVNRTMRVGAGAIVIEPVAAASPHGLAPVLAQCTTVGISGLTLGGGLSWLSGKHGATCDNLLSADLITADGRFVVANADENPDLFWAIRGGGGNFGIATSFEYQLHPISEVIGGGLTYRLADAPSMLRFYRDFMEAAPDELQAVARLNRNAESLLTIVVCFCGDLDKGEEIVRPLRRHASPVQDTVRRRAFIDTFSMTPDIGRVSKTFSTIRGRYLESVSDEAVDIALEFLAKAPDVGPAIGLDHYMHGAVCRVASDSTAFELRQPGALHVWISARWDDPADAPGWIKWTDETWHALQPYSAGRMYANYPGPEGELPVEAAYGANYSRLIEVKEKYDPSNVFRLNQNIRSTSA